MAFESRAPCKEDGDVVMMMATAAGLSRGYVVAAPGSKKKPNSAKDGQPLQALAFRFRCAAIDVGSNAVCLLAARFSGPVIYQVLEELGCPVLQDLEGEGGMLLEGWALKKRADLFQRTIGLPVKFFKEERGSA